MGNFVHWAGVARNAQGNGQLVQVCTRVFLGLLCIELYRASSERFYLGSSGITAGVVAGDSKCPHIVWYSDPMEVVRGVAGTELVSCQVLPTWTFFWTPLPKKDIPNVTSCTWPHLGEHLEKHCGLVYFNICGSFYQRRSSLTHNFRVTVFSYLLDLASVGIWWALPISLI